MTIISLLVIGLLSLILSKITSDDFDFIKFFLSIGGAVLIVVAFFSFLVCNEQRIKCNMYSDISYKTSFYWSNGCYIELNQDLIAVDKFEEIIKNKYNNPQNTINLKTKLN